MVCNVFKMTFFYKKIYKNFYRTQEKINVKGYI